MAASRAPKKPNRTTTTSIFIRCSDEEKVALEQAAAKLAEAVPGAKLPVHKFVLTVALERAKELGFTPGKGGR